MASNEIECKGITTSGEKCRLKAGPSGYCHLHDPEKLRLTEESERKAREEQDSLTQRRKTQLQQIRQSISDLEAKLYHFRLNEKQHKLLESVVDGLYIEIEKLTRKAPAEQITELALDQINDVIVDTKALIQDDPYIQKLQKFVSAGDHPELRDALIVVRQVKQGLGRFSTTQDTAVAKKLKAAKIVESALEYTLDGVAKASILDMIVNSHGLYDSHSIPDEWKVKAGNHDIGFNFDYLDSMNLNDYFTG